MYEGEVYVFVFVYVYVFVYVFVCFLGRPKTRLKRFPGVKGARAAPQRPFQGALETRLQDRLTAPMRRVIIYTSTDIYP